VKTPLIRRQGGFLKHTCFVRKAGHSLVECCKFGGLFLLKLSNDLRISGKKGNDLKHLISLY
jgi:hypothetical protein